MDRSIDRRPDYKVNARANLFCVIGADDKWTESRDSPPPELNFFATTDTAGARRPRT